MNSPFKIVIIFEEGGRYGGIHYNHYLQSEGRRHNSEMLDARNYRINDAEDNQYEQQPSEHVDHYIHQPSQQYQVV